MNAQDKQLLNSVSDFITRHQAVLGATFSALCLVVAMLLGLGRFEARAVAQEQAIHDLQQDSAHNLVRHEELARDISAHDTQLRAEILQRLDSIITKQDVLSSRLDTTNDRLSDVIQKRK